jgi:hypothetical protein
MGSVVDQHRFDADPDPDHTSNFTQIENLKKSFHLFTAVLSAS